MAMNLWRKIQYSFQQDTIRANNNRVGKILGHDQPQYTLPHVQWQNHISSLVPKKNPQLVALRRYPKLRMK